MQILIRKNEQLQAKNKRLKEAIKQIKEKAICMDTRPRTANFELYKIADQVLKEKE